MQIISILVCFNSVLVCELKFCNVITKNITVNTENVPSIMTETCDFFCLKLSILNYQLKTCYYSVRFNVYSD